MTSRMRVPSLKSQECPFEIHFNWINLKKHVVKKAKLLLQVNVTFCNPNHTCKMDTHSHRTALQKAGRLCLDFGKVKSLLFLLLEKPHCKCQYITSLFGRSSPTLQGCYSSVCCQFPRPCIGVHHTKNGGNSELTMEDATAITSDKKSAADEMVSTDLAANSVHTSQCDPLHMVHSSQKKFLSVWIIMDP
jgi:hypothetical protein